MRYVYSTQFGGAVFDDTLPVDFTIPWASPGTAQQVVSADSNFGGRVFVMDAFSAKEQLVNWTRAQDGYHVDADLLMLLQYPDVISSTHNAALYARGSGTEDNENCYVCAIDHNPPLVVISEVSAGTASILGSGSLPFTLTNDAWYYLQFRIEGTRLQGRAWEYGTYPYPGSWLVDITDSTHTAAGYVGFGKTGVLDVNVDYVSIATGGETVDLPPVIVAPSGLNTIQVTPAQIATDATAFLTFTGEPNRSIDWNLTGDGTIGVITNYTNEAGLAFAKYTPGTTGTKTITVTYGT